MSLKSLSAQWTPIAGLLLIGASLAWIIKLGVIISTNGRIIDTGAAALCMRMGLLLFVIGSTGIGYRVSVNRNGWLRAVAMVVSPVVVFGSFLLLGMITGPFFKNSSVWYAEQEAPVGVCAIVYLAVGYFLYRSCKPAAPQAYAGVK
jgi:hypothetical protein